MDGWFGLDQYNAWELHWKPEQLLEPLLVLLILIPFTLWFFWTSLSRIQSPLKKFTLFGLRVVTLVLLILLLLQPQLELKNIKPMRNTIAVLLDDSKSVSIKTFPSEKQRIDLIQETLHENATFFDDLKEDYQVDFYLASDRLDPLSRSEISTRHRPQASHTDFSRVLNDLATLYEGKSLQGVMWFTDGADLLQQPSGVSSEISDALAHLEGPLYTYQAGSNERFKDLAIESLEVSDFGFVHQPVQLRVMVSGSGLGKKKIPVVLKEGDKILSSQVVSIDEATQRYPVEMEFTPVEMGKKIFTLSVPVFSGESIDTNNQYFFQVNVVRDRIRVLHLNGRPSWDSRFLREVLTDNPKVDLLSFFILRTLSDDVQAQTTELSLIPFPSNLLFSDYLSSFDLVIFHNFKFSPFIEKKYLANIKRYVNEGGAFLMVGGDLSFQAGGYQRTPLESVLPVEMDRKSKWISDDEFQAEITESYQNHPVLRLEKNKEQNRKAWKVLPPLNGMNIGLLPIPGAQVLVSRPGVSGEPSAPLVAAGSFGEGRSMAIATDTSWNWNFLRVGEGGSGRYYQKFWDNALSWLTRDPEMDPLQIETDREKYREKEKVLIKFRVLGEDYNPLTKTPVTLTLTALPGDQEITTQELTTDVLGEGTYEFMPTDEGFYSARITLGEAEASRTQSTRFSVFSPRMEFQKPRVNSELLKFMAEATGGRWTELGEGTRLESVTFPNPEIEIKINTRTISLWDSWWSYGLILSALVMEWWLRRKSGLS